MRLALDALEREMQLLDLWAATAPTRQQLASAQPFCVDTMAFEQWLQWVFIPRLRALLEQDLSLPGSCHIKPMGEHSLLHLGRRQHDLLAILDRIDRLASGPD